MTWPKVAFLKSRSSMKQNALFERTPVLDTMLNIISYIYDVRESPSWREHKSMRKLISGPVESDEQPVAHKPCNCQCFTPVPSPLCSICKSDKIDYTSCSSVYNQRHTPSFFLHALSSCYSTVSNKTVDPSSTQGGGVDRWLMVPIIGEGGGAGAR